MKFLVLGLFALFSACAVSAVRDEPFEVTGTLVKWMLDFFHEGYHEVQYGLKLDEPTEAGDLFLPVQLDNLTNLVDHSSSRLDMVGIGRHFRRPRDLPLNHRVTVRGVRRQRRHGRRLTKGDVELDVETLEVAHQKRANDAPPESVGPLKVLVLMITLANSQQAMTTAHPCAKSQWQTNIWDGSPSINAAYQFASHGLSSMPKSIGNVVGPYVVQAAVDANKKYICDPAAWAQAARSAADAAGVGTSTYDILHYGLPNFVSTTCGWSGLGEVGGADSWSAQCASKAVSAHEIGHNIGLSHASRIVGTSWIEYGDGTDVMGGDGTSGDLGATFSALHRYEAGWLSYTGAVQVVTNNGVPQEFNISQLNADPTSIKYPFVLQFLLPDGATQWFSYRTASGLDTGIASPNTVSAHWWTGSGNTVLRAYVPAGGSFRNASGQFTLNVVSVSSELATVRLTFDATAACSVTLLAQGFESGLGSWTLASTSAQMTPVLLGSAGLPSSPTKAVLLPGTPRGVAALQTLLSPPITLSGVGTFTLQFYMKYLTEGSIWFSGNNGYCSEGGIVSVVVNNVKTQLTTSVAYQSIKVYAGYSNPLGNKNAWCSVYSPDSETPWLLVRADLRAYAGQTVRIEFGYGTDTLTWGPQAVTGFLLDAFEVVRSSACTVSPPPPPPVSTSTGSTSTGTTSTGTTSTGTTSTGTIGMVTTSTGTTSTGTTSTGTSNTGSTTGATVEGHIARYNSVVMQSSTTNGWKLGWNSTYGGKTFSANSAVQDTSVKSKDGVVAYVKLNARTNSSVLYIAGFSNPIPAGATATGFKITMNRRASNTGITDNVVMLVIDGIRQGVNACPAAAACVWSTSSSYATIAFGGPTDTWGLSQQQLTATVVNQPRTANNVGFGVAVGVTNSNGSSREAYLDSVGITVYYVAPA